MSGHPGSSAYRQAEGRDSLPLPGIDSAQVTVFLIDDAPGRMEDVAPGQIGLIEVRGRDSILPSHQTAQVVRVYTKAFMAGHPERFGDIPVLHADTLSTSGDSTR
jgi:hypothetical protein